MCVCVKKGYSRIRVCVFFSADTSTYITCITDDAGLYGYRQRGRVKRAGKLVKYDQLKKLNSSGVFYLSYDSFFFFTYEAGCSGY